MRRVPCDHRRGRSYSITCGMIGGKLFTGGRGLREAGDLIMRALSKHLYRAPPPSVLHTIVRKKTQACVQQHAPMLL